MSAPPAPPRRADGSMALLVDLLAGAEDPAYAATAARGRRPRPLRSRVQVGLVLLLVGVLAGGATAALRRSAAASGHSRAALAAQVRRATTESDGLARQEQALRRQVAGERDAGLGSTEAARVDALELATGTVAVDGPGVVVRLSDRPAGASPGPALPRGAEPGSGRVLDADLQELANGLWASGAEAISINDLRLTARTAIRSAGEAILVDYRPLSPPYVVRAIGDPGRLEPAYVDSAAGRELATYSSLYGLQYAVDTSSALHLPAASVPQPRAATPLPVPPPPTPGRAGAPS